MEPFRFDPYCEPCCYISEKPEKCGDCQYWLEQEFDRVLAVLGDIIHHKIAMKGGYYQAYKEVKELARNGVLGKEDTSDGFFRPNLRNMPSMRSEVLRRRGQPNL